VKAFKNFHLLFKYFQQTGLRGENRGLRGKIESLGKSVTAKTQFEMQQLRITILSLYLRKTCIIAQFEFRVIID
jgi:hypothetical protein